MASGVSQVACRRDCPTRLTRLESAGLVCGTGLAVVLADLADGRAVYADVDDRLRAAQIGRLVSGETGWFDPVLPSVAMPEPYLSPWSRLVDLPYLVFSKALSVFVAPEQALGIAYLLWPPLMLIAFCGLAVFVARGLMGGPLPSRMAEAMIFVLMAMLMAFAVLEFAPGRIDHHNVQLVLLLAMAAGLCWDAKGGFLTGAAGAASVAVGLECLPLVVAAFGAMACSYILDAKGSRAVLLNAAVGMGSATVVLAAAFLGPAGIAAQQCDAFSAPQIVLMLGLSLAFGGVCLVPGMPASPMARASLLALASLGVLALAAVLFPACLAGPYAVIDPLSRLYWFDRIEQEQGVLFLLRNGRYAVVAALLSVGSVLCLLLPMAVAKARSGAASFLALYALAAVSLLLALLMVRYIRFASALTPLFLPALVAWWLDPRTGAGRQRAALGAFAAAVAAFVGMVALVKPVDRPFDAVDYMSMDACEGEDLSVLATVAPGRIAQPNGLAFTLIEAMPEGFRVAAMPFHRASPGMKRMYEAFLSSDPAVRRAALAPFDYVAVCRLPLTSDAAFAPLYAALSAGEDWPGLVRIAPPAETRFQLLRIDHAALR
ncbi:hypothetical protein [Shinella zoogloeoides]|uniref:AcrB/AcrD/AcrF family protein n=1 Tax=Shinella zoogloeoides TaxID=352475 RepID=A0A6N8TDZ7_SHIZO|nr:hypothetical protein [Shinella zoogloeoides]MXO00655.1 hypothetical protein [Shinella zoogloeoides]UEX80084.1 hypothetical protein K8M09_10615 [Shinella zoogloeoides]